MKNLSKVLAVVLAFAMALSMVSFAAFTDVEAGSNCEQAVTVLSDLGILKGYEDGSFKPEGAITRAEFAAVVIRLLGLGETAASATNFDDVAADHWASGYIALASQQGIVNGYGDGKFGPEDPVKYNEAIKMIVAALGYTPVADANGGWPGGYQVVASQKGILAGVSGVAAADAAPRGVVAQLAYNALTVPLMEQTGYGSDIKYEVVNSLLLNKLGITKFEGVVTGTSLSSNLKDGKVKVDYNYQVTAVAGQNTAKKYEPGTAAANAYCNPLVPSATATIEATGAVEEAAKALIDVASVMYVKDADSDKAQLVSILKDGSKNETVSFVTEDLKANASVTAHAATSTDPERATATIEVYTDKDAGETEEYVLNIKKIYVNGRTKTVDDVLGVDTAGSDINEGTEFKTVLEYYLKTSVAADVTLLSTVEDEFNVAYITTYQDVKVDRIAARTYKVSYTNLPANTTGSVVLDETDKNLKFEIYKDGEIASFDDIKEDDVLSIAGYIDGGKLKYGKVYIVSDRVEGKVTAKGTNKVSVDGTVYKTNGLSVNLGDTAVFFKNYRGILVAVDTTATAANVKYGFATYIREYDVDYGEPAQIRLMNTEGKWETLDIADQVSINGATKVSSKTIDWDDAAWNTANIPGAALTNVSTSSTKFGVNDIVAYDLNADGKVGKLYFKTVTDVFEDESISGSKKYDADTVIMEDVFMDDATVIFSLDTASIRRDRDLDTEEADVAIVAVASLADGTNYNILAGYDYDDAGVIGALLGYGMAAGIDYADNFFVLTEDPMEATNEAGETGILLEGMIAGEAATLFVNTEDVDCVVDKAVYDTASSDVATQLNSAAVDPSTFGMGDVLLYTLNGKGEAAKIAILVDASDVARNAEDVVNGIVTPAYGYLDTIDATGNNDTVVATVVGNTTYKFVVGYAKEFLSGGNLTIYAADDTTEKTYAFASDAVGTLYDAYTGNGKVIEAMTGDITADSDAALTGNDGDIVFARVIGSRVAEFVVIANSR